MEILPLAVTAMYEFTNPICTNIFTFVVRQYFGISVVYKLTDLVYTSA